MIVIIWLLIGICDCVIFWDSTGSRAYLSAKELKKESLSLWTWRLFLFLSSYVQKNSRQKQTEIKLCTWWFPTTLVPRKIHILLRLYFEKQDQHELRLFWVNIVLDLFISSYFYTCSISEYNNSVAKYLVWKDDKKRKL